MNLPSCRFHRNVLAGNLEIRKLVIFTFYEYLLPKVRCAYFFLEKVIGISGLPVLPIGKCNLALGLSQGGWNVHDTSIDHLGMFAGLE